jgi:hypothetical protein
MALCRLDHHIGRRTNDRNQESAMISRRQDADWDRASSRPLMRLDSEWASHASFGRTSWWRRLMKSLGGSKRPQV